jgi:hypothetical protein
MNKENKKSQITLALVFVCIIFLIVFYNGGFSKNEVKKVFNGGGLYLASKITCTYPQILNTAYINGEITHSLPKPETNPLVFIFSDLENPDAGQLSYMDATQTITNVPLIKLRDDNDKVIYLDGTGENYLSIHTIYKKTGVSTYTKSVSLFNIPSGTLSMGSCVGY